MIYVIIKLTQKIEIFKMRALLKSYDLSDNEIKLYMSTGKSPLTFDEIRSLMNNQSEEKINQLLDNLIKKK